ncbi:MAG: hypothetical protein Q8P80_02000, partial [Candidatus Levybacteria bacterium]|nr:hypothetical protein [Candidatus Levybacteria bacterium]
MRKFFLILFLQIIFVLGIFPSNFSNAWAANDCKFNVTSNPSPPLPVDQKTIELTIDATGVLVEGTPYLVTVGGKPVRTQGALSVQSGANFPFRVSGGKITIPNLAESGEISLITNFMSPWKSKLYKVSAYDNAGISETNKICSGNLDLTGAPGSTQPGVCSIDFTNTSWTPNDDVKIIVNNLPGNPGDGHRIIIRRGARFGTPVKDWCEDLLKEANLKKHEPGNYYVEITDKCQGFGFLGTIDENAACGYLFAITKDGKGGGPISEVPVATPKPLPPPCSEWVDEN